MTKKEFISWITDLGFTKDWSNVYSISIVTKTKISGKLYFSIKESNGDFDIRIHSNFMNVLSSFGSNLGHFPLSSIGEFEKDIILSILIKNFDEVPLSIKKYLRNSKIESILD